MKNVPILNQLYRRISTSTPSFFKTYISLFKSAEEGIAQNAGKFGSPAVLHRLPRSMRALRKLGKSDMDRKPLNIGAVAVLAIPVTTFGLGCWQVQRRQEKLAKIRHLESTTKMQPVPLPQDLRELDKMEYMPVKVVGEFRHEEELVVKPRHRHDVFRMAGMAGASSDPYGRMNEVGAHVITPFKPADRHYKIMIQRGWVPLDRMDPETRKAAQVKGTVEIVGLVRGNEKRPKFVPENDPLVGEWHYRDVEMMGRIRNCAPVYLEALGDTTIPGGPVGGQTLVKLRNEHMSYIMTWFTLSALTGWMWYRRYVRPVRV